MTIQVKKPELEAMISERTRGGHFHEAEDVILDVMRSRAENAAEQPHGESGKSQVCEEPGMSPEFSLPTVMYGIEGAPFRSRSVAETNCVVPVPV